MTLNEVATLLKTTKEAVERLINDGASLPVSKKVVKLSSTSINGIVDVTDLQLDAYIEQFEKEEPGRHPPTIARRELLVESQHRCAVCRQPDPLEFHHMIEWSRLKHHDPQYMLTVCPTDHALCGDGTIDAKAQAMYKARLLAGSANVNPDDPYRTKKREEDLKALSNLFSVFPRSLVNHYLQQARWDKIHYDVLIAMERFCNEVVSPIFYLYDKRLKKLLQEFQSVWLQASDISGQIYHDYNNNGIATLAGDVFSYPQERHERFQSLVVLSQGALAQLVAYIKEQYPDFDQDKLDQEACTAWSDLSDRIERESEERLKAIAPDCSEPESIESAQTESENAVPETGSDPKAAG